MRLMFGVTLLFVLLVIFYESYRRSHDIFHPKCFFALLQALRYVPTMVAGDSDTNVKITISGVVLLFLMELITIGCVCLGYRLKINKKSIDHEKVITITGSYMKKLLLFGYVFYAIGLVSRILFIASSGGVSYILYNIQRKGDMAYGQGYLLSLGFFMIYGLCFLIVAWSKNGNIKKKWLQLVIMTIICIILLSIMSDRAPAMIALMMIIMTYHYNVKKIRVRDIAKPKTLLLILIIMAFIVAMPSLRNTEGLAAFGSLDRLFSDALNNLSSTLSWFSFTGRDIFIYEHYNVSNHWYGANIVNLVLSPIPRILVSWKPPVDEGIYLANAVAGYEVKPPALDYPISNSYPFSNQGICYTNFGIIGLILGSILLGYIYSSAYRILKASKYDPFLVILYQIVIYKFSFTSHDIGGIFGMIGYIVIFLIIFGKLRMHHSSIRMVNNSIINQVRS